MCFWRRCQSCQSALNWLLWQPVACTIYFVNAWKSNTRQTSRIQRHMKWFQAHGAKKYICQDSPEALVALHKLQGINVLSLPIISSQKQDRFHGSLIEFNSFSLEKSYCNSYFFVLFCFVGEGGISTMYLSTSKIVFRFPMIFLPPKNFIYYIVVSEVFGMVTHSRDIYIVVIT